MIYKNLCDSHTHSCYSPDSEAPVAAMCEQAVALGYQTYAITDHCECDLFLADGYDKTVPQAQQAIQNAKVDFAGRLRLLSGVELGQPLQNLRAAEQVLALPFDVVIGSLHRGKGYPDYYYIHYPSYTEPEILQILRAYFEELTAMAKWNQFDILAHLTYPLRYLSAYPISFDVHKCDDIIAELFQTLIQNGKALEINTGSLCWNPKNPLPDADYIKLFHDLGGKYITFGTDAHQPERLGRSMQEGMQLAYDCGFRQVSYFEERQLRQMVLA